MRQNTRTFFSLPPQSLSFQHIILSDLCRLDPFTSILHHLLPPNIPAPSTTAYIFLNDDDGTRCVDKNIKDE